MICLNWADILCRGVIILVSFQLLNKRIIQGLANFLLIICLSVNNAVSFVKFTWHTWIHTLRKLRENWVLCLWPACVFVYTHRYLYGRLVSVIYSLLNICWYDFPVFTFDQLWKHQKELLLKMGLSITCLLFLFSVFATLSSVQGRLF